MDDKQFIRFRHHQECVEELFDDYAATFDDHLVQGLRYDVPSLLKKEVRKGFPSQHFKRCLDLGCGTGLAGVTFRDSCDYLEGVDISSEMVAKTEERDVYDKAAHADLVAHMSKLQSASFDLIISADVVMYVFDLRMLLTEAKRLLAADGLLAFSNESIPDDAGDVLEKDSQRYAHSRRYVLSIADGFDLVSVEDVGIRYDGGKEMIRGDIFVLQRNSS